MVGWLLSGNNLWLHLEPFASKTYLSSMCVLWVCKRKIPLTKLFAPWTANHQWNVVKLHYELANTSWLELEVMLFPPSLQQQGFRTGSYFLQERKALCVRRLSGRCLVVVRDVEGVWKVSGRFLKGDGKMSGGHPEGIWNTKKIVKTPTQPQLNST